MKEFSTKCSRGTSSMARSTAGSLIPRLRRASRNCMRPTLSSPGSCLGTRSLRRKLSAKSGQVSIAPRKRRKRNELGRDGMDRRGVGNQLPGIAIARDGGPPYPYSTTGEPCSLPSPVSGKVKGMITRSATKRILVVEDELMIRMLLEDMLKELGYTIVAEAGRIDE